MKKADNEKARLLKALDAMTDAQGAQASAFGRLADAVALLAKTEAARLKMDQDYDPNESLAQKNAFFDEVIKKAQGFMDQVLKSGRYEPSAEDKAAKARQLKIHEKRQALVKAAWEKTEKAKHGKDCEFDACVCPLYFTEGNRGMLAAQGYPTVLGRAMPPSDYEVR